MPTLPSRPVQRQAEQRRREARTLQAGSPRPGNQPGQPVTEFVLTCCRRRRLPPGFALALAPADQQLPATDRRGRLRERPDQLDRGPPIQDHRRSPSTRIRTACRTPGKRHMPESRNPSDAVQDATRTGSPTGRIPCGTDPMMATAACGDHFPQAGVALSFVAWPTMPTRWNTRIPSPRTWSTLATVPAQSTPPRASYRNGSAPPATRFYRIRSP